MYNFFILFAISVTVYDMNGFWIFILFFLSFFILLSGISREKRKIKIYLLLMFNVFVNIHSFIILNHPVSVFLAFILIVILGVLYNVVVHNFNYQNLRPDYINELSDNKE